jgi:fucose permease
VTAASTPATAGEIETDYRLLHAAAFMSLFCLGLYASSFGPVLPSIAADLGVSLDTAGLMLTALFIGSITSSAAVALTLHRRDTRLLCIAGLSLAIAGLALLAIAPSWPVALAAGVIMGFGDGLIIAATHILMPLTSRDVPSAMNKLNLFFALGAIAGPIWCGAVLATSGERAIAYAGIIAFSLLTLAVMVAADISVHHAITGPDEEFNLPGNPVAWVMGGVLFLYVGAEFGLGSWISSYTRETAHAGVFASALLTSGYWGALALGRVLSAVYFSRRRDASRLLAVAVAGAGISALVLALSSGNIAISAAAAFGAGLCFGPVWPTTIAIASEGATGSTTAATVTIGNAGGLAIPWLQGKVLVGAGPGQGVAVTAALCAAMFGIVTFFRLRRRQFTRA